MRILALIFAFCFLHTRAQDKVFFSDGTIKSGIVVSLGQDYLFFKISDTSSVQKISVTRLLAVEKYNGTRYLFSETTPVTVRDAKPQNISRLNSIGAQPLGVLVGRVTLVYERRSKDGKIGLVIPFSLTFDPMNSIYKGAADTANKNLQPIPGVNFITGADLNFYFGKRDVTKFFLGPRFRYGTDMFLGDIEGLSLQTQFGWRISNPEAKASQHLSFGFGFVRILSAPGNSGIDPKQSYAWGSMNYRIGFNW